MLPVSLRLAVSLCFIAAALLAAAPLPAMAEDAKMSEDRKLVVPLADAEQGLEIFVGKGCVVCHSVNGIGGKAAPALDVAGNQPYFDVFDFAARMWRGAPTMIVLQEMELGYQIDLTGEDLAHLAAFAADLEVQRRFAETDIPEVIRDWMVDEVYQELDPDYMTR
ncbi:c-type cytochrome [Pelagibius litoralis]|uniref:C-type cytochrome n=1 Tax=Pelagibius litoralis TaxID=374515 RepID=A0A967EXF0_9PROT|nr:c-type cytochrome [Pelagibius litoralis]NIA69184.1 c-type cytochrome [Pelagibius litoralis]